MELFWRDTMTCPTEEDYIHMASYSAFPIFALLLQGDDVYLVTETGGLFRLAVRLMAAKSASTM